MIKKIIIRILLVVMLSAFTAVVVVQWLWIKYAIRERENKFTSQVYDVLNRVVNRVDEVNYIKYLSEVNKQLGEIRDYNDMIASQQGNSSSEWYSSYLFNFLNNDISRLNGERSYLSSPGIPYARSGVGKIVNQEFIMQTIRSIGVSRKDTTSRAAYYGRINEVMKEFMLRLVKEKDPENVSVWQRLENIDLYNLLVTYFQAYNIHLPFTYEIMTKQDLLDYVKAGRTKNLYYVDLFQQDLVKKGYYLGVRFESVQSVLLENMGWLFLASGFCMFGLMFVFIITIFIIMRQQKLSVIKNDFINNMTHEFKTPIATISLATSAITKDKVLNDREQILKFNAMIRSENDRMNKYVERILQQAKLDRRELQMNKLEVDLNEMVREAAGHFMLLVQDAGGILKCKLEAEHFVLKVDEVHLMNAVCNLVDNAIKYSGGTPDIVVYTQESAETFIIGVQDHGIGISKDAQKKVFKRFYRVPSGNLHNVKGFGLGLSYVKSIVELHGGMIRLSSKKNKGTLVEIILKKE
ncbi:MAG: HAMP domain-containing sensor histidine kinase [Odoribacter sp.]